MTPEAQSRVRTVQQYIDETPFWADGTKADITTMTAMQWRIWLLACAAQSLRPIA